MNPGSPGFLFLGSTADTLRSFPDLVLKQPAAWTTTVLWKEKRLPSAVTDGRCTT